MNFGLTPRQRKLVATAESLVPGFAARAGRYDRENQFPAENFAELRAHNFLALAIPEEYGGLGLGIDNGDPLTLWLITKNIAKGDNATGQCLQVHTNFTQFISVNGTAEQKQRYLGDVVKNGALMGGWGSEPPMVVLGQPARRSSSFAKRVQGGYIINGEKYYCTNAGAAKYGAVGFVVEGARDAAEGMVMLMVDTTSPGVTIKPEWWSSATGMRATVSHLVKFDNVFVGEAQAIGEPGDYVRTNFQAKLLPQFASNFLGGAEAALEFALEYLKSKQRLDDPYVQHYLADMRMNVQTITLWLFHTAWLWETGQVEQGQLAGHMYRCISEDLSGKVIHAAIQACGATSTMSLYPLERIHRDLTYYLKHENYDSIKATIGKAVAGLEYNAGMKDFLNYAVGGGTGETGTRPANTKS